MSAGLRILKVVGESPFWRSFGKLHTWLYRASGGTLGHSAGHIKNLLLTTTGRRSRTERTVPLAYVTDGADYVVVASNGGADRHPAWWLNLQDAPQGRVQIGTRVVPVVARIASPPERARLWPQLKAVNPFYARYEQITAREIPVVILQPVTRSD
jgi:deazaflavin-dependent oxidoreductase (nitroreductase family)